MATGKIGSLTEGEVKRKEQKYFSAADSHMSVNGLSCRGKPKSHYFPSSEN